MKHKLLKVHNLMDYLLMSLVVVMIGGLLYLFFTSIGDQIETKKTKLQIEAARLENKLDDIYRPFNRIALLLQSSFVSCDDFDSGIIQSVQYDKEARLSYLSEQTAGFGGTFVYAQNLADVSDEIKEEIIRTLNVVPAYDENLISRCFFISRHGFAVYFNHVDIGVMLDAAGSFGTMIAFNKRLMDGSLELYREGKPSSLAGPYSDPVGNGIVVSHLQPVVANGEIIGVLGCNILLEDLDAFVGMIGSKLGLLYLISDTNRVLAGYENNETLYGGLKPAQSMDVVLAKLNVTEAEIAAAAGSGAVFWRDHRVILICPVLDGEFHIIYGVELLSLVSESNLIMWFVLCLFSMLLTVGLLVALIKNKRKILVNNLLLRKNVEKLDYLSQIDGLTGLMKSETIIEKMREYLKLESVIVCMLDIDYFKQINDNYLHTFGNVVIKRVADVIRKHIPEGAYAGRFGGDEFVCLLVGLTPDEVCNIAESIRSDVEALRFREHEATVTLSIGIARSKSQECGDVIEKADQLLYRAKQNGRNQWLYEE